MPPEATGRKPRPSNRSPGSLPKNDGRARQLPLPPPFPRLPAGAPSIAREDITIYTIGHSNQSAAEFVALLDQHGLQTLVDVRSAPYSRHAPHFNRGALAALLAETGIRYIWAGEALGGRPADSACYRNRERRAGNVDYAIVARQPWFQEGLDTLQEIAAAGATAVMCSEEEPRRCHRHLLLEPALRERGIAVRHIRRGGTLETIDPGASAVAHAPNPQLILAGFAA